MSRLLVRLYAIGVVQLVVVAIGAIAIGILVSTPPPFGRIDGFVADSAAAGLEPSAADPAALAAALVRLQNDAALDATVWDADGKLVATNVEPPIPVVPPPGPPPRPFLGPPGPPPSLLRTLHAGGRELRLVVHPQGPPPSRWPPFLTLACGLVVVGVSALFTRRFIVRPLDRIATAARALGAGELGARTGLRRGDEIGEVARAFDDMAARVERLVRAEKELLGSVSHELRTPVARIRVALDLASEGDPEAAKLALGEIRIDLDELETLLDDVLTTTKLALDQRTATAAELVLHRERVGSRTVAEHAVERFRARHPERPLEASFAEDAPELDADPMLVRRLLENLLENAQKYSPDPRSPITLELARDGAGARFVVRDHGDWIAEADLPHVFEPFFRADRSRTRATGGVGLGLTLASRVASSHSGTIAIDSATSGPQKGTRVTVTLPAAS